MRKQQSATALISQQEHASGPEIPEALSDTITQLEKLRDRPERWNGHDVAAANPASITHALAWIQSLFADVQNRKQLWIKPYVTTNEDGNVVFEWMNGQKDWMVTILPDEVSYMREDAAENNEPETGKVQSPQQRRTLWSWLRS